MVALSWCLELLPTAIRGEGSLLDHEKHRRATQESNSIRLRLVTLDAAASLICRHDEMFLKPESLAQPLDCGWRIAIPQAWNHRRFGILRQTGHDDLLSHPL